MKSSRLLLIGIIVIGAAMRIYWNDVTGYSPADESSYTTYARHLLDRGFVRGYPDIVHWFDDDVRMWRYPNPLRIGYLALATTAIRDSSPPPSLPSPQSSSPSDAAHCRTRCSASQSSAR
jgi:hypothetical protein